MNAIIIGTGKMALIHASNLDKNKKINSFSVYGRNTLRLKRFENFKKSNFLETDLEQLIQKTSLQIAIICLPHKLGKELINQLILAGCHIFTEKPSFVSTYAAKCALKYLSQENKFLMVGYTLRFLREIKHLKKIIDLGSLGALKEISIRISRSVMVEGWLNNPTLSTGVVGELAVHAIDLARFLTNQEIAEFSYQLRTLHKERNVPDSLNMSILFSDGVFAKINASMNIPIFSNEIIVVGEDSTAMVINGHVITRTNTRNTPIKKLFLQDYLSQIKLPLHYLFYNPYKAQINEFINNIELNKPPECDLIFDLPTIKVCQQLLDS